MFSEPHVPPPAATERAARVGIATYTDSARPRRVDDFADSVLWLGQVQVVQVGQWYKMADSGSASEVRNTSPGA